MVLHRLPPSSTLRLAGALAIALAAVAAAACGSSGTAPVDAGEQPPVDAATIDGLGPDLGEPCDGPDDCPGGFCVDSPAGDVCTYACDQGCPPGWECRVTDVDGQLTSVCLPGAFDVCTHCESDEECNAGVCVELEGAGFCLPRCFESTCPPGYTCGADPTGEHTGEMCVPDSLSCTCNATTAGTVRTCTRTNMVGTCTGFETCDPATGWSGCTAADASPEVCDGLDNDCDQLIDDGTVAGACTIDVAGVGSCPGVEVCTGGGGVICQGQTPTAERCNSTDDDCDLMTDEGFAGLGDACTAGMGACQRFGVQRCTGDQLAVECSAVPGMPGTEACNAIDDDCDGAIDDGFADLGAACTVGAGVCVRQGTRICTGDGTGTTCSAMPGMGGPEACNLLDDDCDGTVDEDFKNPVTGVYDRDNACGSCAVDCTVLFDLPNAGGTCDATGMPHCELGCDPNAFDLDGVVANGCELVLDTGAIYVSVSDPDAADDATCGLGPVGTGAGNHPCLTIGRGLARAVATGRARVLVANGLYNEAVTLVDGKDLLGGHSPDDWQRDVAGTGTLIAGESAAGAHDRTVIASGIMSPTLFEGFVVYGAVNARAGGNSYAVYVSNSSANLVLRDNVIFAGRGGPGQAGGNGAAGSGGGNGTGRPSNPAQYDARIAQGNDYCIAQLNDRSFQNGAAGTCGGDNVSGGHGGGVRCEPVNNFTEFSGLDGVSGQAGDGALGGGFGAGADAGDDMRLDNNSTLCYVPNMPTYGQDGLDGRNGMPAMGVGGCGLPAGGVVGGHWVGGVGNDGAAGGNGGGGGGGGAGGGAFCYWCAENRDRLGGHGGGGGAGGCGGAGGAAARGGGGAFGVFVVGGAAPVVTGTTFGLGEGGPGGTGGAGGTGGPGGLGATGGTTAVFCSGPAGRGGNGGAGGHGSGGGGGCGGASIGVYTSGVGNPNYCQAGAGNTFFGGAGGAGGAGGYSPVNQGGPGQPGARSNCSFN